ncbi:MAG: hypothetical protein R3242_11820 [Akkermansiaceae bacterium]|nr:hypothetical protein [Akkermansiaceae bacterium]
MRTHTLHSSSSKPLQLLKVVWNPQLSQGLLAFISVVIFIVTLGYAWPVFFNEGSALMKNLEHRELVDAVDDAAIEAAMVAALYGEQRDEAVHIDTHDPTQTLELIHLADKVFATLCLVLAAFVPFLARWRPATAWLYLIPALWVLLNGVAATLNGGKAHAALSIPAHATRFILPVALALLLWRPSATGSRSTANWLLRIACALTFGTHGFEALQHHPAFQDLIYSFGMIIGVDFSTQVIHLLLYCIGTMDMLLALSVLLVHSPAVLRWMTFWGLLTAFSRPLTISWLAWPEFAIRLANGICPWLVLAIGMSALISRGKQSEKSSAQSPERLAFRERHPIERAHP